MLNNKYYSCGAINGFHLNFNNNVYDRSKKSIRMCCHTPDDYYPGISLSNTGKETMENFKKMRLNVIKELANGSMDEFILTKNCINCKEFKFEQWSPSDKIEFINLAMYPSRCQCKCIYCDAMDICNQPFTKEVTKGYDIIFDTIEYGIVSNIISNNVRWLLASGEISIHPYREKIFDVIGNNQADFLSNCFIYDDKIAANLKHNTNSTINLSIDAGTPETWNAVKGFNNFDSTITNIFKYQSNCSRPDQIILKYIIIPGVNDSINDYIGIINLMKALNITYLQISSNRLTNNPPLFEMPDGRNLMKFMTALGWLRAILKKNGFNCNIPLSSKDSKTVDILSSNLIRYEQV